MIEVWENYEATRCCRTGWPLTRSLDLGEEGLAMQATRTCSLTDCDRPHYGKGLCQRHLERKRREDRQNGLAGHCAIEDCGKTVTARGWCEGHYRRWVEHGDPLAGRRSPDPGACSVAACERRSKARGWCKLHYYRWKRTGDVGAVEPEVSPARLPGSQNVSWRGPAITYPGAHNRVYATQGRASDFQCVDCGRKAAHWSYDHADPNEQVEPVDLGAKPYSVDPRHYQPRCSPCHYAFDHRMGKRVCT